MMAVTLLTLFLGALLGVIFDRAWLLSEKVLRRRNPLAVNVRRACNPPAMYVTNLKPPADDCQRDEFDKRVQSGEPFYAIAKINLEVTNKSREPVYVTDISIRREPLAANYSNRVYFITQGSSMAVRLRAFLDDPTPRFVEEIDWGRGIRGCFFERGDRILVAPGETERIKLGFLTVDGDWVVNCDLHYSIAGRARVLESLFGEGIEIVHYDPRKLELDYCSFKERIGLDYPQFEDAGQFVFPIQNETAAEREERREVVRKHLEKMLNM